MSQRKTKIAFSWCSVVAVVVKRFFGTAKHKSKSPAAAAVRGGREGKSDEKSPFPPPFAREWYENERGGRPGLFFAELTVARQRRTCTGFAASIRLFSCEKDCMPWLGIRQWLDLGHAREHLADDWGCKQTDQAQNNQDEDARQENDHDRPRGIHIMGGFQRAHI